MTSGRIALLALLALTAGCGGRKDRSAATAQTAPDSRSALERAGVEAGVVADVRLSPVGLYRKRHEAGTDSLCIVPSKDGRMDFALEAAFGEGVECRGQGTARASGDKLILNFARSACLAVVRYEGDRISFPGAMDIECRKLCSERGSLEGVSIPRISRDEGVARSARATNGSALCG